MLRPYQQQAVDAAIKWVMKTYEPCLIEAATGAGKSHIIAEFAKWLNHKSGKKVLCLAPSKELVEQNHAKYLKTGHPASIYSASINKSLRHDVVFGSPLTVLNSIEKFGDNYSGIIIDEAHGITNTIREIVSEIQKRNKRIRVIGLTATPYRMGMGYIYQYDENGEVVPEDMTREPYFNSLIYRITARELIDMGFLAAPHADPVNVDGYDTDGLELNSMGRFDAKDVEQVFEGKGRKTSAIVADIVANSAGLKGVMIFAATIQHAQEVMESLDPANARIVTGKTKKKEREKIISDFKKKRFKYLVNVAVLTTGFDATHVDHVAIMRATESAGLLQQIVGRGARIEDGKTDFLVSDYAKNIERHCPDGDIFNPRIKVSRKSESFFIQCECPVCHTENEFAGRSNPDEFEINDNGYFVDLAGDMILNDDDQPVPAHHGRRCYGQEIRKGVAHRCEYRWSLKVCDECEHENDIAARYCEKCKSELVDPNEKLVIEFHKMKKNPNAKSTDKVLSWNCKLHFSKKGSEMVKADFVTEYGTKRAYFGIGSSTKMQRNWEMLCDTVFGEYIETPSEFMDKIDNFEGTMPKTVTAEKVAGCPFYNIFAFNRSEDEIPQIN